MDDNNAANEDAHEHASPGETPPELQGDTLITRKAASTPSAETPALPMAERYQFVRKLGQGGMAAVYDAHDTVMDRPVAIKVLRQEYAGDPAMVKRFYEEARVLAHMDHPGILPVHDQGELPEYGPFYAMKRVAGKNLEELMRTYTDLDLKQPGTMTELVDIFKRICDTMAYAHGKGIIHRDLKPQNIMVGEFGVVLVLDWGISKRVGGSDGGFSLMRTEAGAVMGTPQYMSPEQASGKVDELDFRSDVFALGVILFELLTGRRPFGGKTSRQVITDVQERTPVNPRKINPRVPRALAAICLKALKKDPDQRYQSALGLVQDLQLYEAALPTTAHKPSLVECTANSIIRHPVRATAVGVLLIVMLLLSSVVTSVIQWKQLNRQERIELVSEFTEEAVEQTVWLDAEIQATREALNATDPLPAADQRALENYLAELAAARFVRMKQVDMALVTVLPHLMYHVPSPKEVELMEKWNELGMHEFERLIEDGELYKAHYMVWMYLHKSREMSWTDKDLNALLDLKSRIEALLLATDGIEALPDWSQYDTQLGFLDLLLYSSQ